MALTTRKADGRPRWPLLLLVGHDGTGKTHNALAACTSPLIGRTFYVGVDERDPDDFAFLGDFDIVPHEGTVSSILATLDAINAEDEPDGKPNLLVLDSGSQYWALVSENKHLEAAARPRSRTAPTADVSNDLWQDAGRDWRELVDRLRAHRGPVIITARLEREREWKIVGHKTLPFDVDAIVELPDAGEFVIRKAPPALGVVGRTVDPDFTVDEFWQQLGLGDGEAGERSYSLTHADETKRADDLSGRDWKAEAKKATDMASVRRLGAEAAAARASQEDRQAIRDRVAALEAAQQKGTKPTTKKGSE